MEEEKKGSNGKRCYNCFSYNCHFTKSYMKFNKEKTGTCDCNKKVVGHRETCEHWRSNQHKRRRMNEISVKALNETIGMLVEITSVIKDDIENRNISRLARERLNKRLDEIEAEINK